MTECTTKDCANPTDLYICSQCIRDLAAWIEKVPAVYDELFITMAKLDNTTPKNGGGGGKAGSTMPLRLGAAEIRHELAPWRYADAYAAAEFDDAGTYAETIEALINRAEKIIDIQDEVFTHGACGHENEDGKCATVLTTTEPDAKNATCETCGTEHDLAERRADKLGEAKKLEPLPAKEARAWMKRTTGVSIKTGDFLNWVKTGKLRYVHDRVVVTNKPTRVYFPHDVYQVTENMRARRRHIA